MGLDPRITITASDIQKVRNERPDKRPHSITRSKVQKILANRAASTKEGSTPVDCPPPLADNADTFSQVTVFPLIFFRHVVRKGGMEIPQGARAAYGKREDKRTWPAQAAVSIQKLFDEHAVTGAAAPATLKKWRGVIDKLIKFRAMMMRRQ